MALYRMKSIYGKKGGVKYKGPVTALSQARMDVSGGTIHNANNKAIVALFAGGNISTRNNPKNSTVVDTYNESLTKGTATSLTYGFSNLVSASVGEHVLFGGGRCTNSPSSDMYAYSTASVIQSKPYFLTNNVNGDCAATSVGNYALFGGGYNNGSVYFSSVDTYDTSLTKGTAADLTVAKQYLKATSIGNYALFAGGCGNYYNYNKTVDTYNTSLTKGTATDLTYGRAGLGATSVGDYALFAGGYDNSNSFDIVEVYNNALTKCNSITLSQAFINFNIAITIKNYALFGLGVVPNTYNRSNVINIYNKSLTRSIINHPTNLSNSGCANVNNFLLVGGGSSSNYYYYADVLAYEVA